MSDRHVTRHGPGAAIVVVIAAVLALAACSSSGGGTTPTAETTPAGIGPSAPASAGPTPTATPTVAPIGVSVSPANQATDVRPDSPVTVTSATGALSQVSVKPTDGSADLTGSYSADKHTWTSTSSLGPGVRYNVAAVATAGGRSKTLISNFTTLTQSSSFKVSWEPVDGQVVGVGEPIVLDFTTPVQDRAAVQKRLSVSASPPVNGAWHWYSDTEVHWRPQAYWRTGTKVTVQANLLGFDAGDGAWGVKNRTMTFTIGPAQISKVDGNTHQMVVTQNGRVVKTMPVSLGRAQYPSMEGPHNVLDIAPKVIMDSATVGIPKGNPDYYYETVYWDVQYTSGGEYVHAAPWSTGSQGNTNVSHGCVNVSPQNAEWFYHFSRVGDIVDISHTGRAPDTSQLGTDWAMPWKTWVAGDAILGHTS